MEAPHISSLNLSSAMSLEVTRSLMQSIRVQASRNAFFEDLSIQIRKCFHFDRLCINLYDQAGQMLTLFTAAKGTTLSTLSPIRPAELSSTVAGHAIASKKTIIITDFSQFFPASSVHPIAEAGLSSTIAIPLELNDTIVATIHCSFATPPDEIYDIASFLTELSPAIATCLGAVLSLEYLYGESQIIEVPVAPSSTFDQNLVYHSQAMQDVVRKASAVAQLNIPVLIVGETGTGKTELASFIHRHSLRKDAAFVRVNCPSIPEGLFESELFGHSKGAFTGATNKRLGRFEVAHKGTIFLDEIAELNPEMQSKLLQVFDNGTFERVGESIPLAMDARLIAATNVKLGEALAAGRLRQDFYYRVSLFTIEMPPLRERKEDLPALATHLSETVASQFGLPKPRFTVKMIAPLYEHSWPGNIRELRSIIGKIVLQNSIYGKVTDQFIARIIKENQDATAHCHTVNNASVAPSAVAPAIPSSMQTMEDVEREHIKSTLRQTGGLIAGPEGAAAKLGIPRTTLQYRMKKLNINKKKL